MIRPARARNISSFWIYNARSGSFILPEMADRTDSKFNAGEEGVADPEAILRDTLRRCSPQTVEAALKYRESGDLALVSVVVLGIVERFLDPDLVDTLRHGGDQARFMEDLGMDSLTMIEAIMMVEEAVGISIKNEELIGLRTVGDLKVFIQEKISGAEVTTKDQVFSIEQIAATMPHQEPFLFLQEASLSGSRAVGSYRISGKEDFLKGHFKQRPIFPASILLEALGQLAVFSLLKSREELAGKDAPIYFAGAEGVRCQRVCVPGDVLELSVELKRLREPLAVFSGKITVRGEKAVSAEEITLAIAAD